MYKKLLGLFIKNLMALVMGLLMVINTSIAQEKRALVIGNGDYRIGALKNPVNDALSVASTLRLRQLGFQVTELHNGDLDEMDESIRQFSDSVKPGSVAMIYYAGHGMQYRGENYLIPIGMNAQFEDQLPRQAIGTSFILDKLSHNSNGLNILVLDACRDNPLQKRYRSQTRGLARIDITPPNTFTLLATGPNQVALDNPRGNNGLFTKYLVQHMKRPGLDLAGMVIETRKQVMAASANKQVPYSSDSLTRRFCFAGCGVGVISVKPESNKLSMNVSVNENSSNQHVHHGRSHSHPLPATGSKHTHSGVKPVKATARSVESIELLTQPEKSSIESVCSSARILEGPSAYKNCLAGQLKKLTTSPKIGSTSHLTSEELGSLNSVCSSDRILKGPAAYRYCMNAQLKKLATSPKIGSTSHLTREELSSLNSVCSSERILKGPAAYRYCMNAQLKKLATSPKIGNTSHLTREEVNSIESACSSDRILNGPSAYRHCVNHQLGMLSGRK